MALATGAPLLPVFLIRRPDDTYSYIVEEPIWPDPVRDTVATIMRRMAVSLERVISRHSEQWFLFHNPWDIEADRTLATTMAFGAPVTETSARHLQRHYAKSGQRD